MHEYFVSEEWGRLDSGLPAGSLGFAAAKHRPSLLVHTRAKQLARFAQKNKKPAKAGRFLGAIGLKPTQTEVGGFTVLGRPVQPLP